MTNLQEIVLYQCPALVNYLLPSDVLRLASTGQSFWQYFVGDPPSQDANIISGSKFEAKKKRSKYEASRKKSPTSLKSSNSRVKSGELWWTRRCMRNLAFSVIGVVHPLTSSLSWLATYCALRNQYQCKIAARFTRCNYASTDSPTEPQCFEKWLTLHNEELEEAGLQRFFEQSDFYKHQLATVFVLTVRVLRQGGNSFREGEAEIARTPDNSRNRRFRTFLVHNPSQQGAPNDSNNSCFNLFVRQSFTEVPRRQSVPVDIAAANSSAPQCSSSQPQFPSNQPQFSSTQPQFSSDETQCSSEFPAATTTEHEDSSSFSVVHLQSSLSPNMEACTDIVKFCPDSALLPSPSTYFPSSSHDSSNPRNRSANNHNNSSNNNSNNNNNGINESQQPSDQQQRSLQLCLSLPSRAKLVEFHNFVACFMTESPATLSLIANRLLTPSELMLVSYRLTSWLEHQRASAGAAVNLCRL